MRRYVSLFLVAVTLFMSSGCCCWCLCGGSNVVSDDCRVGRHGRRHRLHGCGNQCNACATPCAPVCDPCATSCSPCGIDSGIPGGMMSSMPGPMMPGPMMPSAPSSCGCNAGGGGGAPYIPGGAGPGIPIP